MVTMAVRAMAEVGEQEAHVSDKIDTRGRHLCWGDGDGGRQRHGDNEGRKIMDNRTKAAGA